MDRLIDALRKNFHDAPVLTGGSSSPGVASLLESLRPALASLRPHLRFDPASYQRRRIYRDGAFEVVLLCWEAGQQTPVHDHDGQAGWFTVLEGALAVQDFLRRGGPADLRPIDALPPGSLALEAAGRQHLQAGTTVCEAAAPEAIHRVSAEGGRALSLHVYARPLDSFLVFDLDRGACQRIRVPS